MVYPSPPTPKADVRRAGQKIASGHFDPKDLEIVDQWRASHGYVINTFQALIKNHIGRADINVEFAQRLKRRNTVIDKLQRTDADGNYLISDVSAMHDFAGCRMIFDNIIDLTAFRKYMHSAVVVKNVEHKLRHEPDKYDYIQSPKSSGYRGIHDVYKHFPRGTSRKEEKKPWDGLLVELQYRTRAQHAWATAVEISDLLDGQRTKFEMNQTERGRFFALASEIIARVYEGETRAFIGHSTVDLKSELESLDDRLGLLQRLGVLRQFDGYETLLEHNVLSISIDPAGDYLFEAKPFKKAADAIAYATELEEAGKNVNAVYVRAEKPQQLRSAYRNYFYDPIDFVKMIREA